MSMRWAYHYSDERALARALVAPGGLAARVGPEREPALRRALVDSLERYRLPDGSYPLAAMPPRRTGSDQ